IEGQREAALDKLGPELERLLGHSGTQSGAVVVDRPPGRLIAVPSAHLGDLLLGDPALPRAVLERLQPVTRVVAPATSSAGSSGRGAASTAARLASAAFSVCGRVPVSPRSAR